MSSDVGSDVVSRTFTVTFERTNTFTKYYYTRSFGGKHNCMFSTAILWLSMK